MARDDGRCYRFSARPDGRRLSGYRLLYTATFLSKMKDDLADGAGMDVTRGTENRGSGFNHAHLGCWLKSFRPQSSRMVGKSWSWMAGLLPVPMVGSLRLFNRPLSAISSKK